MSIASDCGACMAGNHGQHDRNHGIREGMIGGTYCDCSGDCAERARARGEALRALLTAPDPTAGEREHPTCVASGPHYFPEQCQGESVWVTSSPAVAASTGTSWDEEALAREVCPCSDDPDGTHAPDLDAGCGWALALCRAVLASDWLAAREAAARAEERERIAQAIEADRSGPWNGMHHEALRAAARIAREGR